ncbi:hypothetical protein BCR41DRAFT_418595 [Lobosporangium transversale]|uniref:HCP-like protein n=1 Tax=Lobosporangium transversale TaxID=64571 RepID=A0A1Y2H644_9FUNG|nr:hypothetical protein BCR41DRAFT_418595 [Lobosporangium transversale]ORZ28532.1 hypothetical protein BCR41DRAFT_418595 [Lobosporangium transversale]|eukprot:XP_021886217.1 hypothetical protein BCR41DRAFT_418595 [Lobosporangium transversale]
MVSDDSGEEKVQAFRLVSLDGSPIPGLDIQYIEPRYDRSTRQYVILWNDIVFSYKDAMHVKKGKVTLSCLTDDNLVYLEPLRIRAEPDIVLNVVISLQASYLREPYPDSTTAQRNEDSSTIELYEATLQSSVKKSNIDDRKSLKADGTASLTVTEAHSEDIPSYEESAELMAVPLSGEIQPGGISKGGSKDEANLRLILKDNGDPQDYSKAFDWYYTEANWGWSGARTNMGYMYYHGMGVQQSYSDAFDCYSTAAKKGNVQAQSNIGCLYEHGKGVEQDYSKAIEWYLKAANQGNAIAQINLGWMYFYGKGVEQDYSKAFDWCLKPANLGNASAQSSLGYMYLEAKGDSKDYSKATYWLLKAASQENTIAQSNLGYIHSRGKGVKQDYSKAFDWYLKAANLGNATAQSNLGYMYYHGVGVSQDHSKAYDWYLKAADQGCASAQRTIGSMYRIGKGTHVKAA